MQTEQDFILIIVSPNASNFDEEISEIKKSVTASETLVRQISNLGNHGKMHAIKVEIQSKVSIDELRSQVSIALKDRKVDHMLFTLSFYLTKHKAAIFDLDSTLIKNETIDEIARQAGVFDQVTEITRKAMVEGLDFAQALNERVSLLRGLEEETLKLVWNYLELNEGAFSLIRCLKANKIKTALVSGGFSWFSNRIAHLLGLDEAVSNKLEFEDGKLTGKVIPPIVDGNIKAEFVELIASKDKLQLIETIAVGDGANDRLMVEKSGFGVAFHAKPILKQATKYHINFCPLSSLAFYLNLEHPLSSFPSEELELCKNFLPLNDIKQFATLEQLRNK